MIFGKGGINTRVSKPQAIYSYKHVRRPGPGASGLVFQRHWADPVQNIFGRTILNRQSFMIATPALQVYPATLQAGLGGILNGQMALQPLLVTDNGG